MKIANSPAEAAVYQPKKHKTAKQVANAALTGAALYGLYKGRGYVLEPFQDAVVSGKEVKYPAGKFSSKLCKFFDKLGEKLIPDEKILKRTKKYVSEHPNVDLLKRVNQFKGFRGAVAVATIAIPAAIAALAAGIYNAVKISKQPAASTSRFPKNSPEVDKFMQGTMDDIAISQMEVKLSILKDKITAYDTTPEQRAAMKQEYDATNKEYEEAKKAHGIA